VYRAHLDGAVPRLFLKPEDRLEGIPIAGTEGALEPFFSPDGEWIGFFSDRRLWKVPAGGSASPLAIAETGSAVRGVSWGPDDTIVVGRAGSGLARVSVRDGTSETLTVPDVERGEVSHQWPSFLADGEAVVFNIHRTAGHDHSEIAVLSLATGEIDILSVRGTRPRYVDTGHLLYGGAQSLVAVPFDEETLQITGPPVSVIDGVWVDGEIGRAEFAVNADGTLVYAPPPRVDYQLTLYRRTDRLRPLTQVAALSGRGGPHHPRFSADGRLLVYQMSAAPPQHGTCIRVHDLESGSIRQITAGIHHETTPLWLTPDAERLIFSSDVDGVYNLFSLPTDGSATSVRLLESHSPQLATSVSPSGEVVLYQEQSPETGWDILALSLVEDGKSTILVQNEGMDAGAVMSPDGGALAYVSDVSGRPEIYARSYPDPSEWTARISTAGGYAPRWSPDGREIFFVQNGRLMVASVEREPEFVSDTPRVLYDGPFETGAPHLPATYDISADGETFVLADTVHVEPTSIYVVLNWFDELERLPQVDR
jgi:serine/threonine-protein kinase